MDPQDKHMYEALQRASQSPTLSAQVILDSATRLGLVRNNDIGYIHELFPLFSDTATALLCDLMDHQTGAGVSFQLLRQAFFYISAKAIEAVVLWGASSDGKISVGYDPKDFLEGRAGAEVPDQIVNYINAYCSQYAQPLFYDYQNWCVAHIRELETNFLRELKSVLLWVALVAQEHSRRELLNLP